MKTRLFLAGLAIAAMASCTVESPETAPVLPDTYKVFHATLGDDDTRTALQQDGSVAHVFWNTGDAITVFGLLSNGGYYKQIFTTADGGSAAADFACHSWNPNNAVEGYYAFYPASEFSALGYDAQLGAFLGVSIPPVQAAIKNGVASDLLFSCAEQGNSMAGDLHFKNMLSLLRFRIDGKSAGDVRSIKFTVNGRDIVGDGVYYVKSDEYDFNTYFPPLVYEGSNSVELIGPFESGVDYYMAFAPCPSIDFTLSFIDGYGNVIVKRPSKAVEFPRSGIVDLGTVTLDKAFGELPDNVIRYMESSQGRKPVVIAVTGDGFTAAQQDDFVSLAKSGIDFLFDTEPYKTYKDYFTVYILPVVSNESGASVTDGSGTVTTKVDNFFGSGWGESNYMDMNADKSKIQGYLQANLPDLIRGTHTLDEISSALIINDARYGGICHMFSNGFSYAMVPYTNDGGELAWGFPGTRAASESDVSAGTRATTSEERDAIGVNHGDWRNTLIHEFGGHGIGRLGDEYWGDTYVTSTTIDSHNWPVPFSLNVSAVYDDVPWKAALLDNLSILTSIDSRYARIGRYQGGEGYILNRWRSEVISCMIDNRQYFSTWQRILIVTRIKSLAGDSFSLNDFVNADVTRDPVRDGSSASSAARLSTHTAPLRLYPPLAPPVLHEE